MTTRPKIIVLDDDPTGSQTVHSCLLLTRWDVDTLRVGLADSAPLFFILTNTRAQPPEVAAETVREVCRNLKDAMVSDRPSAIAATNTTKFLIVSRSDSTLRGHYPLETDVIAAELGPFDAHFLVPAFIEGGRVTLESVHYLEIDGVLTPVHETEFARDSVFGYHHSYLPGYVAEKTGNSIPADQVKRFLRSEIQAGLQKQLLELQDNACVAVDAETQSDLDLFAADVFKAVDQGKRFLFRSAASLLTGLAQLPPQPIPAEEMVQYVLQGRAGVYIVGSHVQKTTEQLAALLKMPGVVGIEIDVAQLRDSADSASLLAEILDQVKSTYDQGKTPVVYTSRQELTFADVSTRLHFGVKVSSLLMDIVENLPPDIGYLVSKGGITSNDTLSKGLNLRTARLLGQVLAGVSMIRTEANHPRFPNLPVVLFPGNVGDAEALATVYQRLTPH
ncbi:MAG: four-carbon acid sugar kinase family protein [Thermosynechococcaceae cyanobacterium]